LVTFEVFQFNGDDPATCLRIDVIVLIPMLLPYGVNKVNDTAEFILCIWLVYIMEGVVIITTSLIVNCVVNNAFVIVNIFVAFVYEADDNVPLIKAVPD
jgi:hypothetical protein